jgi:succinate dehydrogenase/fumarate reductase flavoprotein subunit
MASLFQLMDSLANPAFAARFDVEPVETCDVLVVGYGAAGAVAAIEAARGGARVLLVEKMLDPGGISILSAGGVRAATDADSAFDYLVATCGGRTDSTVLRALAEGMVIVPDYLRTLAQADDAVIRVDAALGNYPFPGFDCLAYAEVQSIPGFDETGEYLAARPFRPGCKLFKMLADNVTREAGIAVWLETQVTRLLRHPDGAIAGATARRAGRAVTIRASQAVILTCGGFEADPAMQRQYLVSDQVVPGSFRGNTGDGVRMAQQVGADLWHMWHYHGPYGFRHSDPDYPFGIYTKLLPMWTPEHVDRPLPRMAWIIVDQNARRYTNEYPPYVSDTGVRQFDHFEPQQYRHSRLPSVLVFDEVARKLYPMGRSITNDRHAHYAWSQDNLAEVDNGILQRADSLPALAVLLGIDPDALDATVARWNALCAAGADTDFGRRPETMVPIATPPFYAGRLWPVVINTQGGPVHDAQQRVLDPFGEPIEGLYAAGELGSVFGHVYMAGGNLAECIVGGRNAARSAVALLRRATR